MNPSSFSPNQTLITDFQHPALPTWLPSQMTESPGLMGSLPRPQQTQQQAAHC